jgi:hypothetical protein
VPSSRFLPYCSILKVRISVALTPYASFDCLDHVPRTGETCTNNSIWPQNGCSSCSLLLQAC